MDSNFQKGKLINTKQLEFGYISKPDSGFLRGRINSKVD